MRVLCKVVAFFDGLAVDGLTTFDLYHGADEGADDALIFIAQLMHGGEVGELADGVNVRDGVVFAAGCPGCKDCRDGGAMVVLDVATHEDAGGTDAVLHIDELFEVGVGWVLNLAQPYVAYSDVEGVVVADASGDVGLFLCHNLLDLKPNG